MRYKLVRYVGVESKWAVAFALEQSDGQLVRAEATGSPVRVFESAQEAFFYVHLESGAGYDPAYCVTWEGSIY